MKHIDLDISSGESRFENGKMPVLLMAINHVGYYSLPIRILALTGKLTERINKRYDIKYSEWEIGCDLKDIIDAIMNWKPGIIGFSVNIWNRDVCFDLIRDIKHRNSKVTIIAGGQEMTNSVIDYMRFLPELDYIIDGEGELPFIQFLDNWDIGNNDLDDPHKVSGLHYRKKEKTVFTGTADSVGSLEEIPSVVLHGLVNPKDVGPIGVLLEGTRGCPFRCSFCFEALRRNHIATAPVKRLIDEIEYMLSSGISSFHIMDPILCNASPERLKSLSIAVDTLGKKYNRPIEISVEVYGDRVNEEAAEWIGNFSAVDVGLQSINPETLKAINRPYSHKKFCKGISALKQTDTIISIYLIIGLPHDTFRTCLAGIKFAIDQQPTKLFLNELILLNGTELRRRSIEFGYDYDLDPPYIIRSNKWISNNEFSILKNVSVDISRRYNLSFEALPQKNPLFKIKKYQECLPLKVCLNKRCKNQGIDTPLCQNVRQLDEKGFEGLYQQANNKNIEFIVDTSLPLSELLHHAAQFQLAGANRMAIYAPILYFSEIETISKMINSGIWHFKPVVLLDVFFNDNKGITAQTILKNINKKFPILGRGHIHPYLECILFYNKLKTDKAKEIINVVRFEADSIALLDIDALQVPKGKPNVLDIFVESLGVRKKRKAGLAPPMIDSKPNYWLKLRTEAIHWVLNEVCNSKINTLEIQLFEELGLSYTGDFPTLCFND